MKKIFIYVLVLSLILSVLSSCDISQLDKVTEDPAPTEWETDTQESESLVESDPSSGTAAEINTDDVTESQTETKQESDSETESKTEIKTETQTETETETQTETQTETNPDPQPTASNGIEYEIGMDGEECMVIGIGSCTDVNIVIASEYQGVPVTKIGSAAFRDADIESVYLPDTITAIHPYAFYNCRSLKSINIPDSVKSIMNNAFDYCKELYDDVDGVYYVDNWAVGYDKKATWDIGLAFRDGTVGIAHKAFAEGAFIGDLVIPDSVKHIGTAAFSNVRIIQGNVVIGDGVDRILPNTFYQIEGVKSVTFGKNIKSIGDSAFYFCRDLEEIVIPEGVTEIGVNAFYRCYKVTSVTLPSTLKTVSQSAFFNLGALTTVNYTGSEEQWAEISIDNSNSSLKYATIIYNYTPDEE